MLQPSSTSSEVNRVHAFTRLLPTTLLPSLVGFHRRHHNGKGARKGIGGSSRRVRPAVACGEDPLRIFGAALEIRDPGQEGTVTLKGKVTWFDPVRSRYCIVQDRKDGIGIESGGSNARNSDCAHWIGADKLVQMKAVAFQPRHGRAFVVARVASTEEKGLEGQAESVSRVQVVNTTVKLEHQDGQESGEEGEDGEEIDVTSAEARREVKKEQEETMCEMGKRTGEVDPEETESENEEIDILANAPDCENSISIMRTLRDEAREMSLKRTSPQETESLCAQAWSEDTSRDEGRPLVKQTEQRDQGITSLPSISDEILTTSMASTLATKETQLKEADDSDEHREDQAEKSPLVEQETEHGTVDQPLKMEQNDEVGSVTMACSPAKVQHRDTVAKFAKKSGQMALQVEAEQITTLTPEPDSRREDVSSEPSVAGGESTFPVSLEASAEIGEANDQHQQNQDHQKDSLPATQRPQQTERTCRYPLRGTRRRSSVGHATCLESPEDGGPATKRLRIEHNLVAGPEMSPLPEIDAAQAPKTVVIAPASKKARVQESPPDGLETKSSAQEASIRASEGTGSNDIVGMQEAPTTDITLANDMSETAQAQLAAETKSNSEELSNEDKPPPDATTAIEIATAGATGDSIGEVAEQETEDPTDRVHPGWPGMEFMGQVSVMRIRAIHISEGKTAKYFAGALSSKGYGRNGRSSSRMTFRFEEIENLEPSDSHTKTSPGEKGLATESSKLESSNPSELLISQRRPEDGDKASIRDENPGRSRSHPEDVPKFGPDTMPPSPPDSDAESLEDGEIETLPDGRAINMPPSPRDEDMNSLKAVSWAKRRKSQIKNKSHNEKSRRSRRASTQEESKGKSGSNSSQSSKDMEISSPQSSKDAVGFGSVEFQGAKGVSFGAPLAGSSERRSGTSDERPDAETSPKSVGFDTGYQEREFSRLDDSMGVPSSVDMVSIKATSAESMSLSVEFMQDPSVNKKYAAHEGLSAQRVPIADACGEESHMSTIVGSSKQWKDGDSEEAANEESFMDEHSPGGSRVCRSTEKELLSGTIREGSTPSDPESAMLMSSQQADVISALRSIVREQIEDILRSASQGGGASISEDDLLPRIATDIEKELFDRLYRGGVGERAYKVSESIPIILICLVCTGRPFVHGGNYIVVETNEHAYGS